MASFQAYWCQAKSMDQPHSDTGNDYVSSDAQYAAYADTRLE